MEVGFTETGSEARSDLAVRIRDAFAGESFDVLRGLVPEAEAALAELGSEVSPWVLVLLANAREEAGLGEEALALLEQADVSDVRLALTSLMVRAEVRLKRFELDLCRADLVQAGALLTTISAGVYSKRIHLVRFNLLARVCNFESDVEGAIAAFDSALAIADELELTLSRGRILSNLGSLHHARGSTEIAFEHYREASQLIEADGDHLTRGQVAHNLAQMLLEHDRFDEALVEIQKARNWLERAGGLVGVVYCDVTLMRIRMGQGQLDQARIVAHQLEAGLDSWSGLDQANEVMAHLCERLWDLREIKILRRVLSRLVEVQTQIGATEDELLSLHTWDLMAKAADGEHESVLVELPALLDETERMEDPDYYLSAVECAVIAYEASGDLKRALEMQRLHNRLETRKLYEMMDVRVASMRQFGVGEGLGARDLESRLAARMEELSEYRRRLQREAEERQEAGKRERELERSVLASQRLEAVGRLAGGVAHDFNNMLTIVRGNAERLAEISTGEAAQLASEVLTASMHGANLVGQLLAFSKRGEVFMEDFSVDAVAAALLPMLQRLITEDIELAFAPKAGGLLVHADRAQLESVIVNLVLNAQAAMPAGGRIAIETEAGPNERVHLFVRDEGTGVLPEHRELIFDPFFTTRTDGSGTGMGLASALGIASRFGGNLRLLESSRFGSTFELALPVVGEEAVPSGQGETQTAAQPACAPQAGALAGKHILYVEDNESICRIAAAALTRVGAHVEVAPHGAAALELVGTRAPFNLIITDVVMPGMGGPELFEKLSSSGERPPFLFTSGYPQQWSLDGLTEAADVAFVAKPFDLTTLVAAAAELAT